MGINPINPWGVSHHFRGIIWVYRMEYWQFLKLTDLLRLSTYNKKDYKLSLRHYSRRKINGNFKVNKKQLFFNNRLRERQKVRDRIWSAPLMISHQARSSILNDKSTVFNVITICSPLRGGLCERTLSRLLRPVQEKKAADTFIYVPDQHGTNCLSLTYQILQYPSLCDCGEEHSNTIIHFKYFYSFLICASSFLIVL